jgi:hypothetical protein
MYKLQADSSLFIVSKHTLEYYYPNNILNKYIIGAITKHKLIFKGNDDDIYYVDINPIFLELIIKLFRGETIDIRNMNGDETYKFNKTLKELNIIVSDDVFIVDKPFDISSLGLTNKFNKFINNISCNISNNNSNFKYYYNMISTKLLKYIPHMTPNINPVELDDFNDEFNEMEFDKYLLRNLNNDNID